MASGQQSKDALVVSYQKRLKDDVKSILENFMEIVRMSKVDDESQVSRITQANQDRFEAQVRAANIVRATESLTKLISDIKQYLILNDFPSLNDSIVENLRQFRHSQSEIDNRLAEMKEDVSAELHELEDEYYMSLYKE